MPVARFAPVVVAGLLLFFAPSAAAQTAECSQATATALVNEHGPNPFLLPQPIAQLLCGPFTGPGSQAMAVEVGPAPTCWPIQHWAVFRYADGAWQPVLDRWEYVVGDLVAVGGGLRVTTAVHRFGDPRCVFRDGTEARTWRWNGSRLVAGAPEQVTPPEPLTNAFFNTPRGLGVQCGMSDQPDRQHGVGVNCTSVRIKPKLYVQRATLGARGRVTICRDGTGSNRCNLGNSGEDPVPTYGYGRDVTVGRFRCRVLRTGVRCTVVATGKGFVISRARAARIA